MAGDDKATFPPAEGARRHWEELPGRVRSAVEGRAGGPVVEAITQPGGFSPGLAARLRTADGGRLFVKAVGASPNPHAVELHRREARVAAALPMSVPAPRLRWVLDEGDWVVLAFDDVGGTTPQLPWRAEDLERVLAAVTELADALTPSPLPAEPAGELLGPMLMRWRDLSRHPDDLARLDPAWRRRLDELVELEGRWPDAAGGESLVHLDLRADNIVLTSERVYFVDWPWAAVGASWLDLVALLPSVAMQGGPVPEDAWRGHPLSNGVDDDSVDAFLAALTGMFTRQSLLPAAPGLPTLRAFQAAQGRVARKWLALRRGWTD
jgi:aminoglycoside phosphotransferase (APT) family kinase protein